MRTLLPCLMALVAAACSSLDTSFDYDTASDFSQLRAYTWIEDDGESEAASLTLRRVRTAVDDALAQRGYRADPQAPDFFVAAHVTSAEKVEVTDWGYTTRPHGGWYGQRDIDVYTYDQGTLVLDVVDATSRSLMWRGTASRTVDASWTPEKREEIVREAVEALLGAFPPQAGR